MIGGVLRIGVADDGVVLGELTIGYSWDITSRMTSRRQSGSCCIRRREGQMGDKVEGWPWHVVIAIAGATNGSRQYMKEKAWCSDGREWNLPLVVGSNRLFLSYVPCTPPSCNRLTHRTVVISQMPARPPIWQVWNGRAFVLRLDCYPRPSWTHPYFDSIPAHHPFLNQSHTYPCQPLKPSKWRADQNPPLSRHQANLTSPATCLCTTCSTKQLLMRS